MQRLVLMLIMMTATASPLTPAVAAGMKHESPQTDFSALDRLKGLEGEWVGKAGPPGGEKMDAVVAYHVIADGSAVMETLFPGTPHEMVTMYTLDRGALVLTHYCALHNQPRMKARKGGPPNELTFDFAGGANINPAKDEFMHDAQLVFVDQDHIRGEWTSWRGGRPGEKTVFEMQRKK
jgi:hypothetical protein